MNIPENLKYTRSHEWVEFLPDGAARVGLTDHAQDALGDLVFVNLPEAGDAVTAGEALGDVESVKAVSDIFCPVTGTVRAANEALLDTPAGTILPATVTHLEPFGAFVDVGCGVVYLIGIENI